MKADLYSFLKQHEFQFARMADIFVELKQLQAVEQNPQWHGEGNVFVHTEMVCRSLLQLAEWEQLDGESQTILFLAACFHDIGKVSCTKVEDGIIVSPNHAVRGAKSFRQLWYLTYADQFSLSFQQREQLVQLIRYHGLPLLFLEKPNIDYYLIEARESVDFRLLYLLAKADLLGRICHDQQERLEAIEYFKEYTVELGCFAQPISFYNPYSRRQYFKKRNIWHGECIFQETTFTVYLMSGLPLSGKDTFIEKNFSQLPMISLDQIRAEMKLSPTDGSSLIVAEARERAKVLLRKKQSFVWNATNIIADTRMKVCSLFESYGARVSLVYVEVPYRELRRRNQIRARDIPVDILHKMIKKLEVPKVTEAEQVIYQTEA